MTRRQSPRKRQKGETQHRRCIATGAEMPKDRMVRFVIDPNGGIVADVEARLPGRGFWLSAERDVIHTACVKNLFAKAARAKVEVAADLADRVEGLLVRKCLDLIGLARRAGQAASGFEKVESWLKSGKPAGVLLSAADGAKDGRMKVRSWAGKVPVIRAMNATELGQAFSRERAVHAVVSPGRLAISLQANAGRLADLRGITGENPDG